MKVWEKTKQFCKKHKTAVVSSVVGISSFFIGWAVKKKIDSQIVDDAFDVIDKEADRDLYMLDKVYFLTKDNDIPDLEKEQEELRGKYGQDFAILEEATKNLTEPEKGKLWLIENGVVSLVDGIEYNDKTDES